MSRSNRILLAAALAAFVAFLLLQVPAAVTSTWLAGRGLLATGLTGTLWRGEAISLQSGEFRASQVHWRARPFELLVGRLAISLDGKLPPDGFVNGQIALSPRGLSITDLTAAGALAPLAPSLAGLTGQSQLALQMRELSLRGGWIVRALGTVRLANVSLPVPGLAANAGGSYELALDAPEVSAEKPLVGTLRDAGGPLEVRGTVTLTPPRNYVISGTAGARPGAPPDLINALQMAGPVTSDGHHEFSVSGSF